MSGPTLIEDWFDLAPWPEGEPLDAKTLTLAIQEQRPALQRILEQFGITSEEAEALLCQMIDLLYSRWNEIRDLEAWLATALRACCIEHYGGLPQEPDGEPQADASGSVDDDIDATRICGRHEASPPHPTPGDTRRSHPRPRHRGSTMSRTGPAFVRTRRRAAPARGDLSEKPGDPPLRRRQPPASNPPDRPEVAEPNS